MIYTQLIVYSLLALAILGLTLALAIRNPGLLQPFFRRISPLQGMLALSLLGGLLLALLLSKGWFLVLGEHDSCGLRIAAGLASLLTLGMILVDLKVVLPEDINRPFPDALLFYPVMGFVVEIVFHLLPLALLLTAFTAIFRQASLEAIIWPCLWFVALLETVYQVRVGLSRPYPAWVLGYIGLNVFLINLFQLILFRRNDFISMVSLRMAYYFLWHIAWGYLRLRLLF